MIWTTGSSPSCFCWLCRVSPSSAAENIINLISVLTIWWCSCVESSRVLERGCLLSPVCSLCKTLLAFTLLHFVLQGQIIWGVSPRLPIKDTSFFLSLVPFCFPGGISEFLWTSEYSFFTSSTYKRTFICLSCLFCTIWCSVHVG